MIVVIADDLTGAAELGGLGLQYGFNVEMDTEVNMHSNADLLVISTDTRSMKRSQALKVTADITKKVAQLNPQLVFKKVDSVLRGHILAELTVQLAQLHLNIALLVPANPDAGRTLINGMYLLHGQPIHLSSFSTDPEFAITRSDIWNMLGVNSDGIYVKKIHEPLPQTGIIVGEAESSADLKVWAQRIANQTFVAGASGFFNALMQTIYSDATAKTVVENIAFSYPALFVCGSTFNKSREAIRRIKNRGGPVSFIPSEILIAQHPDEGLYGAWVDEVISLLSTYKKAIISIDGDKVKDITLNAAILRKKTAQAVAKVFEKINIRELVLEGGATASAIIKQLGFSRFFPIEEMAPGVIRMRIEGKNDLCLTLKPGSYDWPARIWNF